MNRPPRSRLYRALLHLLPRSFRDRHGRQMERLFVEALSDARTRGRTAWLVAWIRGELDVVAYALRSRWPFTRRLAGKHGRPSGNPLTRGGGMDRLRLDLRYALRSLGRSPVYAAVAVVTLTVAIGTNASVYALVDTLLFRAPAHVQEPDEVVSIFTSDYSGPPYGGSSYPDFEAFREVPALEDAAIVRTPRSLPVVGDDGMTRPFYVEYVSGNYFRMLGVTPAVGRWFSEEESSLDSGAAVAVVAHHVWEARYGSDPDVIGREVRLTDRSLTIIGVAPEGMGGGTVAAAASPSYWVPLGTMVLMDGLEYLQGRGIRGFMIRGRLAEGASIEAARSQLNAVAQSLHAEYPDSWTDVTGAARRVTVIPDGPLFPAVRGLVAAGSSLALVAVGLVLLIGCVNLATLTLVRGTRRMRELAVRSALGAGRGRLARQLLTETFVLSMIGGTAGTALAFGIVRLLSRMRPTLLGMQVHLDLAMGPRVLLLSAGVTLLTVFVVGLLPALRASRADPAPLIKNGEADPMRARWYGGRNLLIVGQIAVALVLLVGSGVLIRTVMAATGAGPGFRVDDIATATFELTSEEVPLPELQSFRENLRTRLEALPDIERVTLSDALPLSLEAQQRRSIQVPGYEPAPGEEMEFRHFQIEPGFTEVLDIPMLSGSGMGAAALAGIDDPDAPLPVLVNEAFSRRFWGEEEAVGRAVAFGTVEGRVVGVVPNTAHARIGEPVAPAFFLPLSGSGDLQMTVIARTASGRDGALLDDIHAEILALRPDAAISSLRTMEDVVASSLLPQRAAAGLLLGAGAMGLLLAATGLYGVITFAVSQRARELGVRMALGAPRRKIVLMVLRKGALLGLAGALVGLPLAAGATRLLSSLVVDLRSLDLVAFAAASALVICVATLASYLPARRAATADPSVTLREG